MRQFALVLLLALAACRSDPRPALAIGAPAPDFALPGVDGRTHKLAEYAASPVLAVVFTCNHCAASELYEQRIQKLFDDYRAKGAAIVAINPNQASSVASTNLAYSDAGDSVKEMTARAEFRHLSYPYLYDGHDQGVSKAFGVLATPHVFVFDKDRKLRYEGRIDDNVNESAVKTRDARDAIDALLAGHTVQVAHTPTTGCPPVWGKGSESLTVSEEPPVDASAISLEMASVDTLKKLRTNGTDKLLLVNFWATWCGPCAVEFPDLVETARMYKGRGLEFVSVSENQPEEKPLVIEFLRKKQASAIRHLLFASPETYALQAAFDPAMPAAVPFTLVIASNGDVMYQEIGSLDIPKMRRAILANLPDDREHAGVQAYWSN